MDLTDRHSIVAEEVVVVNGAIPPGGGAKIITRLTRRADLDLESAQRYWRTNHAAVATHMHGIARYVQNHARPGGAEYPTMGMPFVWFDSAEALRANGIPVEVHLFPDEGHGFRNGATQIEVLEATEAFFRRHFGL